MITSDLRAKSGCSRQFSQDPRNATRSFRAFFGLQNRRPFSKSTKTIYSPHLNSKVCFTMILKIAVWLQQDLSLPNPAHSSRSLSSSTSFILYRMIFLRTLLALFRSIMSSPVLVHAKIPQVQSYSPEGCSLYYRFQYCLAEINFPSFRPFRRVEKRDVDFVTFSYLPAPQEN